MHAKVLWGTWKCTRLPRAFLCRGACGNVRHSHVLFFDAVRVEMYATPTCFSMRQCTWECTPFPCAFLWRSARGNVRRSHVHFHEAVHVEMYAIPTCLTPMQYSYVLSHVTVHNLVSISHVLMLQCTWKYAILTCLFSHWQYNIPMCFPMLQCTF